MSKSGLRLVQKQSSRPNDFTDILIVICDLLYCFTALSLIHTPFSLMVSKLWQIFRELPYSCLRTCMLIFTRRQHSSHGEVIVNVPTLRNLTNSINVQPGELYEPWITDPMNSHKLTSTILRIMEWTVSWSEKEGAYWNALRFVG